MKLHEILIGERVVGTASRVFIVADVGMSHGGSVSLARKHIDAAADCGVDAVNFHIFRAEKMMIHPQHWTLHKDQGAESAYQAYHRLELHWEDYEELKKLADARGLAYLPTPCDEESVDFLDSLGVAAFKIASSDITHTPLLRHVSGKGKPILLSTGMSYLSEVVDAIWTLKASGAKEILLLHCVSAYPAAPKTLNLRAIETLRDYFQLPVGFSDHSPGILMAPIAVALGAVVLEKHLALDRQSPCLEGEGSVDAEELRSLVRNLRTVESSLGDGRKRPSSVEEENRLVYRRSIVAAVDIRTYETIEPWMLAFKRPGSGLEPRQFEKVIGMRARRNIPRDSILRWEDLTPTSSPQTDVEPLTGSPGSA